jgi:tetratricopeptide (TPR) repeat protein
MERALAINREVYGESHLVVALSLHNLGSIHKEMGHMDEAARCLRRALEIYETILGPEDRAVARTLTILGALLTDARRLEEARPLLERALAIREKLLPPGHPHIANTLTSLAIVLRNGGDVAGARPLLERALAIDEAALGPDHPETADTRLHLAAVLAGAGERVEALRQALRGDAARREQLRRTAMVLPERLALSYGALQAKGLGMVIDGAIGLDTDSTRAALDALIRSRALVLDEMVSRSRYVRERADARVGPLHDARARAEAPSNLSVRGGDADSPEETRQRLDAARADVDRAEEALAKASVAFRAELRNDRVGLDEIQAALPPGSALVAYTRSLPLVPSTNAAPDVAHVAFVLRAGVSAPSLVTLRSKKEIDELVTEWRRQVTAGASEAASRAAGQRLEDAIWTPIARKVEGAELVFVVPDGSLHLVNFAALPVGASDYLLDRGPRFHALGGAGSRSPRQAPSSGSGLLALGGPAYDASIVAAPGQAPAAVRGASLACADFDS